MRSNRHRYISGFLNSRVVIFDRKAKAYLTDECSQFTAKLKEGEEAAAQKWLPRCPDFNPHWLRDAEGRAAFSHSVLSIPILSPLSHPRNHQHGFLERVEHSFKCKYQIVLFLRRCTGWSRRLGLMFYHHSGFLVGKII